MIDIQIRVSKSGIEYPITRRFSGYSVTRLPGQITRPSIFLSAKFFMTFIIFWILAIENKFIQTIISNFHPKIPEYRYFWNRHTISNKCLLNLYYFENSKIIKNHSTSKKYCKIRLRSELKCFKISGVKLARQWFEI